MRIFFSVCLFIYLSYPQSPTHSELCKYYLFVFGGQFSLAKGRKKNVKKLQIKNILNQVLKLPNSYFFFQKAKIKFDIDFLPSSKKKKLYLPLWRRDR